MLQQGWTIKSVWSFVNGLSASMLTSWLMEEEEQTGGANLILGVGWFQWYHVDSNCKIRRIMEPSPDNHLMDGNKTVDMKLVVLSCNIPLWNFGNMSLCHAACIFNKGYDSKYQTSADLRLLHSTQCKLKSHPLTVSHQSHDSVWCPTVVGRSTLIGYNTKQGHWPVGGETESSTQKEYPHLQVHTIDINSNAFCSWSYAVSSFVSSITFGLSGVTVSRNRYMDTNIPAIIRIRTKWRGLP